MILVNGVAAEAIAANDRGLAYGDGIFRTLIARNGQARWWHDHYRKLKHDCVALGIPCPEERLLAAEIERVSAGEAQQLVKIIVTRGSGDRGYVPPPNPVPCRIVMGMPVPALPPEHALEGIRVHLCRTRLACQPRLAGLKHLNRLENVLARSEWSDPSIGEGLVSDEEGHIIGGTMTNLFLLERGGLVTPDLSRCGVAGVTRSKIMAAAAAAGIPCAEEPIALSRLLESDEVIVVNSVIGAWQVRQGGGREWPRGALIDRVRGWLDE